MEIHPTHKGMGWRWSAKEKEWSPTVAAKNILSGSSSAENESFAKRCYFYKRKRSKMGLSKV